MPKIYMKKSDLKDIRNKSDIERLVKHFYHLAIDDDQLGVFFTEITPLDLEVHIPLICSFWESILFNTAQYKGNVILKHIKLHNLKALNSEHFDQWLLVWETSVHTLFEGENANTIIQKANIMRLLMESKIKTSQEKGFIQ